MEAFEVTQQGTALQIDGFPDAAKVIRIDGPRAKRLSDLALHLSDLDFAEKCLDALNLTPEEPQVLQEALWRSAIVHFLKCFGSANARSQISEKKIFKASPPEAALAFKFFMSLRNKHIVHDENSFSQSIPGAIVANRSKSYKIEKVVTFATATGTLEQGTYSNLKLLIQTARSGVVAEYDQLCDELSSALEKETYDSLLSKPALKFSPPTTEEVHTNRVS